MAVCGQRFAASGLLAAAWFPANAFDNCQQDMAAIEDGDGQHIEQGEVYVHEDAEPNSEAPALLTIEEAVIDVHDFDGPTEVLDFDIGVPGKQSSESVEHGIKAGIDLFDRSGMNQGHFAITIPDDSDAWFFVRGTDGLFGSDVYIRAFPAALDA